MSPVWLAGDGMVEVLAPSLRGLLRGPRAGAGAGRVVVGVPCNTFHGPVAGTELYTPPAFGAYSQRRRYSGGRGRISNGPSADTPPPPFCSPRHFRRPPIFDAFTAGLAAAAGAAGAAPGAVRVVHMLDETRAFLEALRAGGAHGRVRTVGVLATTGTREAGLYRSLLEPAGFAVVEPVG